MSVVVQLCKFQPESNSFTVAGQYELTSLQTVGADSMRNAVVECGRQDGTLDADEDLRCLSQLMVQDRAGTWASLHKVSDFRNHIRTYRDLVQTKVAQGGSQDEMEFFRCMTFPRGRFRAGTCCFGG